MLEAKRRGYMLYQKQFLGSGIHPDTLRAIHAIIENYDVGAAVYKLKSVYP